MFAPLVLPFVITLGIFGVATLVANSFVHERKNIAKALRPALVLAIPCFIATTFIADYFRYGRFEYATVSEVPNDGYLELPDGASGIVVHRFASGHHAKFHIDSDELLTWIEHMQSEEPELNSHHQVDAQAGDDSEPSDTQVDPSVADAFAQRFADTSWSHDPRMDKYRVNRSLRGGGYTIWHVAETGDTYLSASYW